MALKNKVPKAPATKPMTLLEELRVLYWTRASNDYIPLPWEIWHRAKLDAIAHAHDNQTVCLSTGTLSHATDKYPDAFLFNMQEGYPKTAMEPYFAVWFYPVIR